MKLLFFGLPLAALLLAEDGHDIALAVLSPIPASGKRRLRRHIGAERVLSAAELGAGLDAAVERRLGLLAPDLIVSWYWTRRLPERWLRTARLGGIGVHPSLLPRHRGPNPFFWTINLGDEETGVTVHRLARDYDTGAIVDQERMFVGERDGWQLARALDRPSLAALRRTVARLSRGEPLTERAQNDFEATWAPEPKGELLHVDFRWQTERVLRTIRALSPVPGLAVEIGGQPLFITRAEVTGHVIAALEPGEAAVIGEPPQLSIRTGDGAIAVKKAVAGEGGPLTAGRELESSAIALLVRGGRSV
jgi:methionyl-tRNA formyltransferase